MSTYDCVRALEDAIRRDACFVESNNAYAQDIDLNTISPHRTLGRRAMSLLPHERFLGRSCNVSLMERQSHSRCTAGVSFGCHPAEEGVFSAVWVSHGCRGRFRCTTASMKHLSVVLCHHTSEAQQQLCPCGRGMVAGSANPQSEAYATVVHGAGMHACAAAINGAILARHDPRRPRFAMTWNVSRESQQIIEHSWTVVPVPQPAGISRIVRKVPLIGLSVTTSLPRRPPLPDPERNARLSSKAAAARRLHRVTFCDVDHFVLPSETLSSALTNLWDLAPEAKMVAFPESAGCFNSGFFMYRPSRARQRELEWRIAQPVQPPICDKSHALVTDQSYLNAVYSRRDALINQLRKNDTRHRRASDVERYTAIDKAVIFSANPFERCGRSGSATCLDSPEKLMAHRQLFHFFDRFAPWGANCTVEGMLDGGGACGRTDVLLASQRDSLCNGHAAAQALWWSELMRLPIRLRRLCYRRLKRGVNLGPKLS